MAIYHLHIKNLSRRDGRSVVAAAAYRAGETLRNDREEKDSDFSGRNGVAHEEIMAPDGAPGWTANREELWNRVEAKEARKDARLAKEVEIALPRELSKDTHIEMLRRFAEDFIAKKLVADVTIHDSGDGNPHAHILLTTRPLVGDGFGKKDRKLDSVAFVNATRQRWSRLVNTYLAAGGSDARVDHRSYAEQGVARTPGKHRGVDRRERINKRREALGQSQLQPTSQKREPSRRDNDMRLIYEQLVRTQSEIEEWQDRQVGPDEQQTKRKLVDDLERRREELFREVDREEIASDKTLKDATRRELLEKWDEMHDRGQVREAYENANLDDDVKPTREEYERTFERTTERETRSKIALGDLAPDERREEISRRTRLDELNADLVDVERALAQTQEARFVSQDKRDARVDELLKKAVDIRSEKERFDGRGRSASNPQEQRSGDDNRDRSGQDSMRDQRGR